MTKMSEEEGRAQSGLKQILEACFWNAYGEEEGRAQSGLKQRPHQAHGVFTTVRKKAALKAD